MKKYLVLLGATAALLLASACASTTPAGSDTPTESSTTAAETAQETAADSCTPVAGGIPATAEDFDCLNLVSVSGSDATGELAWLGTDPLTLVTQASGGTVRFSSKTPCNTVTSAVEVTDTQFIVNPNMAMTMMACQSPQSDYEGWAMKFFAAPLDYTLGADTLVLHNDQGTVTFKSATK